MRLREAIKTRAGQIGRLRDKMQAAQRHRDFDSAARLSGEIRRLDEQNQRDQALLEDAYPQLDERQERLRAAALAIISARRASLAG